MTALHEAIERLRADEVRPEELDADAFRAAWDAAQNCPVDLCADSDDEQCRVLGVAIKAYLDALPKPQLGTREE